MVRLACPSHVNKYGNVGEFQCTYLCSPVGRCTDGVFPVRRSPSWDTWQERVSRWRSAETAGVTGWSWPGSLATCSNPEATRFRSTAYSHSCWSAARRIRLQCWQYNNTNYISQRYSALCSDMLYLVQQTLPFRGVKVWTVNSLAYNFKLWATRKWLSSVQCPLLLLSPMSVTYLLTSPEVRTGGVWGKISVRIPSELTKSTWLQSI